MKIPSRGEECGEILLVAFLLLPSVDFCRVKVRMQPPVAFVFSFP